MADLTDELNEIARTMEDLLTLARENDFYEILERLNQAAMKIMASASRSWFGYHANVYLKDFQPPPEDNISVGDMAYTKGDHPAKQAPAVGEYMNPK